MNSTKKRSFASPVRENVLFLEAKRVGVKQGKTKAENYIA
jgi:hypothetical protein